MAFVKRTIEIHFDSEKLRYDASNRELANAQHDAFMKALGYMVWYRMSNAEQDSLVHGGIHVGKSGMDDVEVCLTYRNADAPPERQGFTMAAIARDGGTNYSTHS